MGSLNESLNEFVIRLPLIYTYQFFLLHIFENALLIRVAKLPLTGLIGSIELISRKLEMKNTFIPIRATAY